MPAEALPNQLASGENIDVSLINAILSNLHEGLGQRATRKGQIVTGGDDPRELQLLDPPVLGVGVQATPVWDHEGNVTFEDVTTLLTPAFAEDALDAQWRIPGTGWNLMPNFSVTLAPGGSNDVLIIVNLEMTTRRRISLRILRGTTVIHTWGSEAPNVIGGGITVANSLTPYSHLDETPGVKSCLYHRSEACECWRK